jgi:hypothetical protein
MAKVKLEKDLFAPHPSGREGTYHLIGRAGALVDEALVKAAQGGKSLADAEAPAPGTTVRAASVPRDETPAGDASGDYGAMKVADLRKLADERGLDTDGLKKDELVEALEDADAQA